MWIGWFIAIILGGIGFLIKYSVANGFQKTTMVFLTASVVATSSMVLICHRMCSDKINLGVDVKELLKKYVGEKATDKEHFKKEILAFNDYNIKSIDILVNKKGNLEEVEVIIGLISCYFIEVKHTYVFSIDRKAKEIRTII